MDISLRNKKHASKGVDAYNQLVSRELKFSLNSFGMRTGAGAFFGSSDFPMFFGGGIRTDVGKFKVKTRVFEVGEDKGDWILVADNLAVTIGSFLRIILENPGVFIEPSYTFPLFKARVTDVNEAINPNTYGSDPTSIKSGYGYFEIRIGIAASGGGG